ncbi:MAG: SpoIVB peptidase S55 domain-containing protein [Actinomycetota bacterium]
MKGRELWGILATVALAVTPMLLGSARAQNAPSPEPLISPDEMLSVDQVRAGMKGYGRSVFTGTKIERFNVTVVGVLRKIDFGGDMVLVRIDDGYPVTSGSGVSQGMSGSPIYVNDKLVGALAFAWPFAKDPIAGVTPISQMLENYRPGSAPAPPSVAQTGDLQPDGGPLKLDGKLFARASVVPDRGLARSGYDGTLYLAPVATPIMVSGAGRSAMDEMRRRFNRFSPVLVQGPGKTELPPAERPRLEPGSAVGVQLLGGDVDATAIGTVTYVKGDHVLAFGHPMFGLGSINMPMTTAYIHGIIASQEVSFKMGSPVETVGQVTQDRNWSIGGAVGKHSPVVDAEFVVADRERGVKRSYKVQAAVQRDLTPTLLYGSLMSAVQSVSPPSSGTTRGTVEVWPKGMAPIRRENVFATGERRSQIEMLFGDPLAGMPMVELLQIMDLLENNTFGTVPVERVRVTVDVSEVRRTATIDRAYADRKRAKPGDRVKLGVVIQPANGPKETRELEIEIPKNIPGGRLQIGVSAGSSAERLRQALQVTRPVAKTLPQLLAQISDREQNDQLVVEVGQPVVGVSVSGHEFPNLPNVVVEVLTGANPAGIRAIRSHSRTTFPTPWVLSGARLLTLDVESDEKDKSGPMLIPGAGGIGGIASILDLFRAGLGGDVSGEVGGEGDAGEGVFGGEEGDVSTLLRRVLAGPRPVIAPSAGAGKAPPTEPSMPSFEELQRILDAEAGSGGSTEGGAATSVQKGLAKSPGVWRMSAAKDFQGGKLGGVLVSSRGELALVPQAAPLLTSPDRFFWAQTIDGSGNVYVGGWLDGSIQKIGADGKPFRFFDQEQEVAVSAITDDGAGGLFAAAEPSGTIYRIAGSGAVSKLCTLKDERIWVLKKIGDTLYAGTGSEGRLYRISMDGKATPMFTAPDRHIYALVDDGAGGLYCGTYPRGKVFHVRDGRVDPVHELPGLTVTALARDAKGNLYVGTSPKASVVKITPNGDVSTVFESKERHVFSLALDEAGNVYAGVGRPARVYRIAPDRTVSTLWEPQAAYVLSLSRDGAGNLYATTAGPTQIVRLSGKPAANGTFVSPVLNAGTLARWGVVRWSGSAEGVEVCTRSGSTAYPDATWSDWSRPNKKNTGEPVQSPPGQYLQYRVTLGGKPDGPSPLVRNLELFYRARNRAPEVAFTAPAAGEVISGTRALRWTGKDADRDRLTYDIFYAPEGSANWVKIGTRTAKADGEQPDEPSIEALLGVTAASGGAGAGHPRLASGAGRPSTSVSARRAVAATPPAKRRATPTPTPKSAPAKPTPQLQEIPDEATDSSAADDLGDGGTSITWNTRKVPDGLYRIRVAVSDVASSPDEPLSGGVISEGERVDNTAPKLLLQAAKRIGMAPPTEITVQDAGAYVSSAECRVDGGEWLALACVDGIFDSPDEALRLDTARLPTGRHVLEIRVRDAAGNASVTKTTYVTTAVTPGAKLPLTKGNGTGAAPAKTPAPAR